MEENILVEKAKNGDEGAFSALYDLYGAKVYSLALRMTKNPDDAMDLSQDIFIKVYKSLPFFKGQSSFSTWLYSIASNACIDFNRREAKRAHASLDDEITPEIPDLRSPESEVEKKELRQNIAEAIDSLPHEMRQIIVLREINGLSYDEIADALDIGMGTVKSRISRARERLCNFLSAYGNKSDKTSSKKSKGGD